jgi:hypothetical protein
LRCQPDAIDHNAPNISGCDSLTQAGDLISLASGIEASSSMLAVPIGVAD